MLGKINFHLVPARCGCRQAAVGEVHQHMFTTTLVNLMYSVMLLHNIITEAFYGVVMLFTRVVVCLQSSSQKVSWITNAVA